MNLIKVTFVMICAILSVSCSLNKGPTKVANDFWEGVRSNGDVSALVTEASNLEDWGVNGDNIVDVKLGAETILEAIAHIETKITYREGDTIKVRDFSTHLKKTDDGWKVDLNNTMSSLIGFDFSGMTNALGSAMSSALQEVSEGFGEGMKEVVEAIGEGLKEVSDAMVEELEKSEAHTESDQSKTDQSKSDQSNTQD